MRFNLKTTARRLGALLCAVMVITAGFGAAMSGAFGPTAEDTAERAAPVGESEAILPLVAVGAFAVGAGTAAWLSDDGVDRETAEEAIQAEVEQRRIDLAVNMKGERQDQETFAVSVGNSVNDSRNIASQKAKARMAEMLNNGTTDTSKISTEVNETIESYYSVQQRNLIARWNTHLAQMNYTVSVQNNESAMGDVVVLQSSGSSNGNSVHPRDQIEQGNINDYENVTLSNGTSVRQWYIITRHETDSTDYVFVRDKVNKRTFQEEGVSESEVDYVRYNVTSISPSDDSLRDIEESTALDPSAYQSLYQAMNQSVSDLKANYGPSYVESIVAQYETGELNTSSLVSAEILANEWGTSYNQTGESIYRWASAVTLGIDAPDLNETARMQTEYERKPLTRMIRFNASLTGSSWSDSTPVNMTLTFDDENSTQVKYTLYNGSGAQDPVVTIPANRNSSYRDIDVTLTWSEGGELWEFSPGSTHTTANGELELTQEIVETVNVTEWGLVFSNSAPSGGWNASESYDLANFSETVYWSRSTAALDTVPEKRNAPAIYADAINNQPRMINLASVGTDSFTVTQIVNDDGEDVSSVGVRDYNRQTTDASDFVNDTKRIIEVQKVIEANEPTLGGGGGGLFAGLFGGLGGSAPIVLVAIGGALALLLSRQ